MKRILVFFSIICFLCLIACQKTTTSDFQNHSYSSSALDISSIQSAAGSGSVQAAISSSSVPGATVPARYSAERTASDTSAKEESGLKTSSAGRLPVSSSDNVSKSSASHIHSYSEALVPATCCEDGYTICTCDCGDSYRTDIISKTYRHTFEKASLKRFDERNNIWLYYEGVHCSVCELEVVNYGNADNSYFSDKPVKYYITAQQPMTLVIYGNGPMPDYGDSKEAGGRAPWYSYQYELQSIIIADGITSVGREAFSHEMPNVSTIQIGSDVASLGWYSLQGLRVKELRLGESLQKIGFRSLPCSGLEKIYLPKSLNCAESFPGCLILYQGTEDDFKRIKISKSPYINVYYTMEEHFADAVCQPNIVYQAW